ncbi:sialidase-4-like [Tamandua tetradactyla]|uniref:sialidase-4-like n=1 Tax=Tamandua tetradactyla TaxID=48850 RepID=UPI004053E9E5
MGARREAERTVLFARERSGLTYRAPAPLPVPPGPTLLAFAEQHLSPDAHAHRLVLRRGTLAGDSVRWGGTHVLTSAALEGHRSMNPCPLHDVRTGTVFLFFIAVQGRTPEAVQLATGRNAARLCCVTSRDAGLTWGGARDLTEEAVGSAEQDWATFAVGPGHGVQLCSGRLLVPTYTYHVDRRECSGCLCRTTPHAFTFYSADHSLSWHHGDVVPGLRSGECQLADVEDGQGGCILYCNARSPLGSRMQALSADEGMSFLPSQLVPALAETAHGCQGSILGFPAPPSSQPGHTPHPAHSCPRAQEPSEEGPGEPGLWPVLRGDVGPSTPGLPKLPVATSPSPTWLLYSHPTGRRVRLHLGIYLSRAPLNPYSWMEPWVIYQGPSSYCDLAPVVPLPTGALVLTFACLYENRSRVSYEEVSFSMFSLRDVVQGVPPGPELPMARGGKARGRCLPS